jgi:hypothetical protein
MADNYRYQKNLYYDQTNEILQEDVNFSLSKGVKIWMAFNRELYFSIKAFFLMMACSFATVTIILRADNLQNNQEDQMNIFLLILFIMHVLDIFSYILDLLGFINKNFKFHMIKCILDVPSIII